MKIKFNSLPPLYKKKVLLFGGKGFIGSHLKKYFQTTSSTIISTHHSFLKDSFLFDFKHPSWEQLEKVPPVEMGIIAAARCRIGDCEMNPQQTRNINVETPLKLIQWMLKKGIFPLIFSSDYVFSQENTPLDEFSFTSPLNEYGRQKQELEEKALEMTKGEILILRLGKVFGMQKGDRTLLDEMITQFAQKKTMLAANDLWMNPISIQDVIQTTAVLLQQKLKGIVHLVGPKCYSRYQITSLVQEKMGASSDLLKEISIDDLKEPFQRPKRLHLISKRIPVASYLTIEEALEALFSSHNIRQLSNEPKV